MLPYIEITQISVGPVKIYTWGLFVGLAFAAGYFWLLWQGRKNGLADGKIIGLTLRVFFGAAVGARVLFLLQAPRTWLTDVSLLWRIDGGGLMVWGGILGGILAGYLYAKKVGWDWRQIVDLAAPALALGSAIGRIGCFLVNDHQGSPTNLPWGILWPDGVARHPVALYEILFGLVMFGALVVLNKKMSARVYPSFSGTHASPAAPAPRFRAAWRAAALHSGYTRTDIKTGGLFLLFLFFYSVFRFFLDFLRAASGPLADPRWAFGLTSSQWVCGGVIMCIAVYYMRQKMLKFNK